MPAYVPPDFLDNTADRTLAGTLVCLIVEWFSLILCALRVSAVRYGQ